MDRLQRLGLEAVLTEDADLSEPDWQERVESRLTGLSDAERVSLDKALRSIGQGTQKALPGVVSGATAGSAAGPWGALVGGVAGGALSLAGGGGSKKPVGKPARRPPGLAASGTPASSRATLAAPSTPASDQAAAQLLRLVQDPRLLQALAALVLGSAGRGKVPAGRATTAPPAAFLNLLSVLAQSATAGAPPPSGKSGESYLDTADGTAVDIASPYERAMRLWEELESADPETAAPAAGVVTAENWLVEAGLAEVLL